MTRVVGARRHPIFSSPAFGGTSRLTVLTGAVSVVGEASYFARGRRVLDAGDGSGEKGGVGGAWSSRCHCLARQGFCVTSSRGGRRTCGARVSTGDGGGLGAPHSGPRQGSGTRRASRGEPRLSRRRAQWPSTFAECGDLPVGVRPPRFRGQKTPRRFPVLSNPRGHCVWPGPAPDDNP